MINRLLNVLGLVILLSCSSLAIAADATATVDKTEIAPGESFTLTISTTLADKPNLSAINKSFEILGMSTNRKSVYDSTSRKNTTTYEIRLILKPKDNSGKTITIPSIIIGKQKTQPITVKYMSVAELTKGLKGDEILQMEVLVPGKALYPQQNAELILRVYASDNVIRPRNLYVPTIKNADLKYLSDSNRAIHIKGKPYMIAERRYQLTPEKSGNLVIEPFKIKVTVQEGRKTVDKVFSSKELTVKVSPKPTDYPANAPWLPAKHISIETSWNKDVTTVYQGDSLTRTIIITAQGLNSSQIGQIVTPTIPGVRTYFDQPIFKNNRNQTPLLGVREDKELFIFTQAGEVTIPEAKIAWWNVDKNQLEYASMPEQKIKVEPNPAYTQSQQPTTANTTFTNTPNNIQPPASEPIIKTVESPNLWYWQLATGFFIFTTVLGFGLWLYACRQPAILSKESSTLNTRTLTNAIKIACNANNAPDARSALDNWAKLQPENINEMTLRYQPLAEAIDSLNTALYSNKNDHKWNGEQLWQAIDSLPSKEIANEQVSALPPLYPGK